MLQWIVVCAVAILADAMLRIWRELPFSRILQYYNPISAQFEQIKQEPCSYLLPSQELKILYFGP